MAGGHDLGLGIIDGLQNAPTALKYTTPALVSVEFARGAGNELDPQMLFQRRNAPGDHRAVHAQLVSGGGKAAQIGHPDKVLHGIEAAHCCYPGNKVLAIVHYFFKVESS